LLFWRTADYAAATLRLLGHEALSVPQRHTTCISAETPRH